jgi:hypothetical protein
MLRKTIWIDLDNTPHVLFFRPIIPELKQRTYRVVVSARDAYQVCEVADMYGIEYVKIGKHYGRNKLLKVLGTFRRAMQLAFFALKIRPAFVVNHGSRSQILAANILCIPSMDIYDYEHAATFFFTKATYALAPEVVSRVSAGKNSRKQTFSFPGIKEDVYAPFFKSRIDVRKELGLSEEDILILLRPPATEAHYHNPESEKILQELLVYVAEIPACVTVILPRNSKQKTALKKEYGAIFRTGNTIFPEKVYDGLELIFHSDLVISGGGTMNREAAALGIPVYSIFRGKPGAVDRYLCDIHTLTMIKNVHDVRNKIQITKRNRPPVSLKENTTVRDIVVEKIIELTEKIKK